MEENENVMAENENPTEQEPSAQAQEPGAVTDEPSAEPAEQPVETEQDAGATLLSDERKLTEAQRVLESLLFASEEILTPGKLKAIVPGAPDGRVLRKMVQRINEQLQKERHPFEIIELGGGYQMRTISYYYPWVRQLFREKPSKRLSIQALECLAIISYRQPITKAEIESIRGVESDGAMKTLLEKHLVTISGRSDKAGRPLLYATTQEFLQHFGINKLSDLPQLEEFEAMAREKMEDIIGDGAPDIEALKQAEAAQQEAEASVGTGQQMAEDTVVVDDSDAAAEAEAAPETDQPVNEQVNAEDAMEIAHKELEDLETVEIAPEEEPAESGLDETEFDKAPEEPQDPNS
jgi:segregation and condensation protein B